MKLRATYKKRDIDGEPGKEESVVIIHISHTHEELSPVAVFVRENGTMGDDAIRRFIITDGAW